MSGKPLGAIRIRLRGRSGDRTARYRRFFRVRRREFMMTLLFLRTSLASTVRVGLGLASAAWAGFDVCYIDM
jgi:hypothetical protein